MCKVKKSAKDVAFEKERVKYRREIRELQSIIDVKDVEIRSLQDKIDRQEAAIREKDEWIDRLLEYMDLDVKDLKSHLASEKASADAVTRISQLADIFGLWPL